MYQHDGLPHKVIEERMQGKPTRGMRRRVEYKCYMIWQRSQCWTPASSRGQRGSKSWRHKVMLSEPALQQQNINDDESASDYWHHNYSPQQLADEIVPSAPSHVQLPSCGSSQCIVSQSPDRPSPDEASSSVFSSCSVGYALLPSAASAHALAHGNVAARSAQRFSPASNISINIDMFTWWHLRLIGIIFMDARSASVHVIFCRCFFSIFFLWPP